MKRFYIPFLIMAVAAVSACEIKAVIEEPADGSYIYTLTATSPGTETKSEYSASGDFSWSAGDKISVLFHKGDDNKFFTLSNTSGAGASATFSGAVDSGYEIGASTDGTKWALYPAGDHKFVSADSKPVKFNIPAETDFTTSYYSANLPLYAIIDGNTASFMNLAAAFKFTFTEVSASKAKLVVENQTTYQMSGDIPIHMGSIYMDSQYADIGSVNGSLTQIASVKDSEVSFYVPVRYWGNYQPKISLYNASNDELLYTNTATAVKQLKTLGEVKPITISVTGFQFEFPSKFGIKWNDITISAEGDSSSSNSGIKTLKAWADASYLYVYFVIDKNKMLLDPSYEYANLQVLYLGDESDPNCKNVSWIWGDGETYTKDAAGAWLTYNGNAAFYCWEGIVGSDTGDKAGSATEYKDDFYYEMRIPRNNTKAPMTSTSTSTAHVGMIMYYQHYHGNSGSYGSYMIAPPKKDHSGQLLRVPLPAYVAP